MKTTLNLPDDDVCQFCQNNTEDINCPKNIYDCPILNEAINNKNAVYVWTWTKKIPKKINSRFERGNK